MGQASEGERVGRKEPNVTFHESVLTPAQLRLLAVIGPLARDSGFYLAGGTAIALRFGHRRSIDFDWFGPKFERPGDVARAIGTLGLRLQNPQVNTGTLLGQIDGIKVSFFEYGYPLVGSVDPWIEYATDIASVKDLGAMKLLAIAQRGSRKDFVDVYQLINQGRTLADMLEDFAAKFKTDSISVLRGLTYFDDAEAEPIPEMLVAFDWSECKRRLQTAVQNLLR
jgi:hypothetical protein